MWLRFPWAVPLWVPGINTPGTASPARVIELLAEETGLPLTEARNHFEAQANRDGLIEVSGQLRTLAYGLMKISNDIRWVGSAATPAWASCTSRICSPAPRLCPVRSTP